jgi:hypothetical protein
LAALDANADLIHCLVQHPLDADGTDALRSAEERRSYYYERAENRDGDDVESFGHGMKELCSAHEETARGNFSIT